MAVTSFIGTNHGAGRCNLSQQLGALRTGSMAYEAIYIYIYIMAKFTLTLWQLKMLEVIALLGNTYLFFSL